MVLTAAAVIVGGAVILFDPIFQGLAVALIGGAFAAPVLSRVAVPLLYSLIRRDAVTKQEAKLKLIMMYADANRPIRYASASGTECARIHRAARGKKARARPACTPATACIPARSRW